MRRPTIANSGHAAIRLNAFLIAVASVLGAFPDFSIASTDAPASTHRWIFFEMLIELPAVFIESDEAKPPPTGLWLVSAYR